MSLDTEIQFWATEGELARRAKENRLNGLWMTVEFTTDGTRRTIRGSIKSVGDEEKGHDGKPRWRIAIDPGTPLELAEIKRLFDSGKLAGPHVIDELARRGISLQDAEEQLSKWEE